MGHSTSSAIYTWKLSHEKSSKINNLIVYLKEIGKKEQTRPKASRKKEIVRLEQR